MKYYIELNDDDKEKDAKLTKLQSLCDELKVRLEKPNKMLTNKKHREIDTEKLKKLLEKHLTLSALSKEMDIPKSILTKQALEALAGIAQSADSSTTPTAFVPEASKKDAQGWVEMEDV